MSADIERPLETTAAAPRRRRRPPATTFALVGLATMGFNNTRVADLTISDLFFFGAVAAIWAQLLTGRTRTLAPSWMRRATPLLLVGALIMLSGGTLSSFGSRDPAISMLVVARYAWLTVAWFWTLRSVISDRKTLYTMLSAIRFTALANAVAVVLGYLGIVQTSINLYGRQAGIFPHPNTLAAFIVMCLPLFVLGVPTRWTHPERSDLWNRWVPLGAMLFALSATGSLTAGLGAVIGIGVAVLLTLSPGRPRSRKNPLLAMFTAFAAVAALVWLSQSDAEIFNRLSSFQEGDAYIAGSASVREQGADFVIDRFDQHLVLGVGFDRKSGTAELSGTPIEQLSSYNAESQLGGSGLHNMLFKLYYEGGGIVALGFLIIIGCAVRQAWLVMAASPGDPIRALAIAIIASIAGLNVVAQFQPMGFERFFWLPVALAGVVWNVRKAELRQKRADAVAAAAAGDPAVPNRRPAPVALPPITAPAGGW